MSIYKDLTKIHLAAWYSKITTFLLFFSSYTIMKL
jgi:hypothetical protein